MQYVGNRQLPRERWIGHIDLPCQNSNTLMNRYQVHMKCAKPPPFRSAMMIGKKTGGPETHHVQTVRPADRFLPALLARAGTLIKRQWRRDGSD
jgi:hypothetical protein